MILDGLIVDLALRCNFFFNRTFKNFINPNDVKLTVNLNRHQREAKYLLNKLKINGARYFNMPGYFVQA